MTTGSASKSAYAAVGLVGAVTWRLSLQLEDDTRLGISTCTSRSHSRVLSVAVLGFLVPEAGVAMGVRAVRRPVNKSATVFTSSLPSIRVLEEPCLRDHFPAVSDQRINLASPPEPVEFVASGGSPQRVDVDDSKCPVALL